MTAPQPTLVLIGPEVMGLQASRQSVEDGHLNWLVGYAPERDEDDSARVVFGTLHVAASNGIAEVMVACMMRYPATEEPGTEAFSEVLAASDALETLWDFARVACRSIAGVVGIDVEVPAKAPEPEISQLVRATTSEEATEATEASGG